MARTEDKAADTNVFPLVGNDSDNVGVSAPEPWQGGSYGSRDTTGYATPNVFSLAMSFQGPVQDETYTVNVGGPASFVAEAARLFADAFERDMSTRLADPNR